MAIPEEPDSKLATPKVSLHHGERRAHIGTKNQASPKTFNRSSPDKNYPPDLYEGPSSTASTSINDLLLQTGLLAGVLNLPVVKFSK